MGYSLGIGGVITYKNTNLGSTLVEAADLNDLVLETDAPYLPPVPFRGTTDCIQALLGGQIIFTVDTIAGTAALVKGGKLRILAVATDARLPSWPQIPTMRELGSAISVNNLWGIAGPKGLDPQVALTLEAAFKFAMEQPSVIAMLQGVEQKPLFTDAKTFKAFAERSVKEQKEG